MSAQKNPLLTPGKFGHGEFFTHVGKEGLDQLEGRELARSLGWAAGCPVVERLTDPTNAAPGRGSEAMIDRYGEVSFWYRQMLESVREVNTDLAEQLESPVEREVSDRDIMRDWDALSIPDDYFESMSPIGTLAGYALPRVLLEEIDYNNPDVDQTEVQWRIVEALDVFETFALDADDVYELTAQFAQYAVEHHADVDRVINHVLSDGWLGEHGAIWMHAHMFEAIEENAPTISARYHELYLQDTGE